MDKGVGILLALVALIAIGMWSAENDTYQSEEVSRYERTGQR